MSLFSFNVHATLCPVSKAPMTASVATFILIVFTAFMIQDGDGIGINYGRVANDLPPPAQVAQFLVRSTTIDSVRIYDADPAALQAFANTGLAVSVTVRNSLIPRLTNLAFARHWMQTNIVPYVASTNIVRILVGNEVVSTTANQTLIFSLVPAMQNVHTVLVGLSLQHRIKVSSSHSLGVLSASYPPSAGKFKDGYGAEVMRPLLSFLKATSSPFMVNVYPFFGSSAETLNYALFKSNPGVTDDGTGLTYANMLDAQLDAVYSAMKLLGFTDVDIVVAETGWPTAGDEGELGVGMENAREYNRNLVQHVTSGAGTPLMPNRTFETYIFALFDEDLKPGPSSERNFGLFRPDMTPVYDIGILKSEESGEPISSQASAGMAPPPADVKRWCIAKPNSDFVLLQENIEYICGQGIDCGRIEPGGSCYFPNTVVAHAAYAMNEYYQASGRDLFSCFFGNTGVVTTVDPSYGSCLYSS